MDLSICIPLGPHRARKWLPWINHQLSKIEFSGSYEVIIATEIPIIDCQRKIKKHEGCSEIVYIHTSAFIGKKRNLMKMKARGTFIACMDADDWIPSYRFQYQYDTLIETNQLITTIDKIPCYDVRTKQFLLNDSASESCLMFSRKVKNKFGSGLQEGIQFVHGYNTLMTDKVLLLVALTHGSNTMIRYGSELKICDIFDEFEIKFLDHLDPIKINGFNSLIP